MRARASAAAERLLQALQGEAALPSTADAVAAQGRLRQAGYDAPGWDAQGHGPPAPDIQRPGEDSGPWPLKGWQRLSARGCDERALETHLSEFSPASRALLLSKAGPVAARATNGPPTHPPRRHDPQRSCYSACACLCCSRRADAPAMGSLFPWAIIVPPAPPAGYCRRVPCPSSMLSRASAMKGARVARNVRLADMNLDVPVADARRIEVVANGLPLWHGLTYDSAIVPASRGRARPTPAQMRSPAAQSMRLPGASATMTGLGQSCTSSSQGMVGKTRP